MGIEDIKKVYDADTQQLIDFYNKQIAEIAERYNNKLKTATEITFYSNHGGIEKLRQQFEEEIKPFKDKLFNIYITATPIYIIKKKGDNI